MDDKQRVYIGSQKIFNGSCAVRGRPGKSAYEVAVDAGFVGTEAEWLASLKGDKGNTGATGAQGPSGADAVIWQTTSGPAGTGSGMYFPLGDLDGPAAAEFEVGQMIVSSYNGCKIYYIASLTDYYAYIDPDHIVDLKGDKGDRGLTGAAWFGCYPTTNPSTGAITGGYCDGTNQEIFDEFDDDRMVFLLVDGYIVPMLGPCSPTSAHFNRTAMVNPADPEDGFTCIDIVITNNVLGGYYRDV